MKQWMKKWKVVLIVLVSCAIILSVGYISFLCFPSDTNPSFTHAKWINISTILGSLVGGIGVTLAIMIYHFQTKDLSESLKNLEHMAFSMQKVDINNIFKNSDEFINKLFTKNMTHILVVSRYSAIPCFWLGYKGMQSLANKIMIKICQDIEVQKKLFIGPIEENFKKYAKEVVGQEGGKIDTCFAAYNRFFEHYKIPKTEQVFSAEISMMTVNAIIIKNKTSNCYGSMYEVIFFGGPKKKDTNIAEVHQELDIYHASIALMARLWEYEITEILKISGNDDNKQWLDEFYKE